MDICVDTRNIYIPVHLDMVLLEDKILKTL